MDADASNWSRRKRRKRTFEARPEFPTIYPARELFVGTTPKSVVMMKA